MHSGLLKDQVGPGQYAQKDVFSVNKQKSLFLNAEKGTGWSKYRQQKITLEHPIQTPADVGPGKYDP